MPEELRGLEANGTTRTVVKNERTYYSSRDFYRLRGVLHVVRDCATRGSAWRGRMLALRVPPH